MLRAWLSWCCTVRLLLKVVAAAAAAADLRGRQELWWEGGGVKDLIGCVRHAVATSRAFTLTIDALFIDDGS